MSKAKLKENQQKEEQRLYEVRNFIYVFNFLNEELSTNI